MKLELLTYVDMHLLIKKVLRGGISMNSRRFTKANNPKVPDYDPRKPKRRIQYYNTNNLYGWAMSQSLPTGAFEWVDQHDVEKGYILEVDLEYPEELHDEHNAYQLAPERPKIDDAWM